MLGLLPREISRSSDGSVSSSASPPFADWLNTARTSVNGRIVASKKVDQVITSNNTLLNDADLFFSVGPNEEWVASYSLGMGAALSTTGFKINLTIPAAASIEYRVFVASDNFGAAGLYCQRSTGGFLEFALANLPTTTECLVYVEAWVLNAATPGLVTLQRAQSNGSATALRIRKGSKVIATRVL